MDGRFAPSPTSDLHLGNLRTALLAWLYARVSGGRFLMRVEDLDTARVKAGGEVAKTQLRDLAQLGLTWDGPIMYQSDRLEVYRQAASSLDTYECFCTRRDIAAASAAPHGNYRPYQGTCANLTRSQRAARRAERTPAIRVRAGGAHFTCADRFAGAVSAQVDDFVLFRADATPAYNLAVVVDDGAQGVQEVVRGADLLDSAPRQGWLAQQLGLSVPSYTHVGLVMARDGRRLAKRNDDLTLADLFAAGMSRTQVFAALASSCGFAGVSTAPQLLAAAQRDRQRLDDPVLGQAICVDDLVPL